MAYEFTQHAQRRVLARGMTLEEARRLFESAIRVNLKSKNRRHYKMAKYGLEYIFTEYYYKNGIVFVCMRGNKGFSKILTVFSCKEEDLVFYKYGRRSKSQK